jgi:phage terminase large subunit-like protein
MKEIASRNPHLGICIDPIGPAAMIADALGATATTMNTASMITACDAFMVGLTEGTIQHRGDPALDIAVESAVKRMIGDAGWAWGRTKSAGSIAPLVAATLAAWQVTHTPPPRARAKVW